jgi:hypothetical protein
MIEQEMDRFLAIIRRLSAVRAEIARRRSVSASSAAAARDGSTKWCLGAWRRLREERRWVVPGSSSP